MYLKDKIGFLSHINNRDAVEYCGIFAFLKNQSCFSLGPLLTVFSCPVSSELPEVPLIEEEVEETESWAKPLVHLWQTKPPNFVAEQEYNSAMARMEPYCAICALLMPYYKVTRVEGSLSRFPCTAALLYGLKNTDESL